MCVCVCVRARAPRGKEINNWYLRACFTVVSLLVFLLCPVAPYCWCMRVIFSSFWFYMLILVSVRDWCTAYSSPMDESSVGFGSLVSITRHCVLFRIG